MEKILIATRVSLRPSWSRIVAERIPPRGETSVFIEAAKRQIVECGLGIVGGR
jgi:hypothetical protein